MFRNFMFIFRTYFWIAWFIFLCRLLLLVVIYIWVHPFNIFIRVYTVWQSLVEYRNEIREGRHWQTWFYFQSCIYILYSFGPYTLAESSPSFSWSWVRFPISVFQFRNYYPSQWPLKFCIFKIISDSQKWMVQEEYKQFFWASLVAEW